jgi:hypothetical protein
MKSHLIVMLTHHDSTVENSLKVFSECRDLPVRFWGFKDVGLPLPQMKELVAAMKSEGKTTFLEVVTLEEADCMRGAKIAVECGFDYLMGTVFYDSVFEYLRGRSVKFFPFCGKVHGHPSILEGSVDEIVADGKRLEAKGAAGIDILAYRHATQPVEISRGLIEALSIPVVIAGSIDSVERLGTVSELSPWAFTIGSALFDRRFSPGATFRDQLSAVLDRMAALR